MYQVNDDHKEDYSFVLGNTKHLKNMSQKELGVLFKNGDARVTEKAEDAVTAVIPVATEPEPAKEEVSVEKEPEALPTHSKAKQTAVAKA